MLKLVHLARRRPEVDHEALVRHWRDINVGQVAAEFAPDRYVVTFFRPPPAGSPHRWDGMAIVNFDDPARGLPLTRALPPAAQRNGFAAMLDEVVRFEADEHVLVGDPAAPLPDGAVKLTFLVVARPGVEHRAVVRHWVDVHAPAVAAPMAAIPGALRYVASPAREQTGGYAGVTELCYADRAASQAHAAALVDDGFGALADNGIYLVGEELIVRPASG